MIRLYCPVKPLNINQPFGNNPDNYYARFIDDLGQPMKGHMGTDLFATHGTPVYAAHDGVGQFRRDSHGGEGVYLTTPGFRTIYWHLIGDTDTKYPSPAPLDGTQFPVKAGDLIGYANNTGAPFESSGDHLHFALNLLSPQGNVLDLGNGYNGAVDAIPYLTGIYAQDVTTYDKILQQLVGLYQQLISLKK